jgi:hypothetical protein
MHLTWSGSTLYGLGTGGIWRYDSTAGWSNITGNISGYGFASIAASGSDLYVSGSTGLLLSPFTFQGGVLKYDQQTQSWYWILAEINITGDPNLTWYNLAIGGSYLYATGSSVARPVTRYDPATGSWSDLGDTSQDRYLAWDGSGMYAAGGNPFGNNISRYDPALGTWTNLPPAPLAFADLVWDGSELFARDNSYPTGGEMWRYDPGSGAWTDLTEPGLYFSCMAGASSSLYAGAATNPYTKQPSRGVWHFNPGGTFPALSITAITPTSGLNTEAQLKVTISGTGFKPRSRVQLKDPVSGTIIDSVGVSQASGNELSCYIIFFQVPPPGTYDLIITNPDGQEAKLAAAFTIVQGVSITSVTPNWADTGTEVEVAIAGAGFKPDIRAALVSGPTSIEATTVTFVSSTQLTCKFNLADAPVGAYDIGVVNPGGEGAILRGGFSVTAPSPCGFGSGLGMLALGLSLGLMSLAGGLARRRKS